MKCSLIDNFIFCAAHFEYAILAQIQNSNLYKTCNDTEWEMSIVLHICLFLMSNNSGYVSLGNTETIVLFSQSGET